MKSPKAQFLAGPKDVIRRHIDRVDDPEFQHVLMVALAHYTFAMGTHTPNPANEVKRIGAQEFIQTLCNLPEPKDVPRSAPSGNLIPPDFRPTADRPTP